LLLVMLLGSLPAILAYNPAIVQARQPSDKISAHPADDTAAGLHFVTSTNTPIANEPVWVLCYADEQAQTFIHDLLLTTDATGAPTQPLPSSCAWITALHQQYLQPSSKPGHGAAYRVFATSWRTGSGTPEFDSPGCSYGISNCAVARPADGDIVIRTEWPLVLFDVVASLEWTPEAGSKYVAEVRNGLDYASQYLADVTDGYMALGQVNIYTGGRNWEDADLRFQAANDLRPAAFIGGIVNAPILYTAKATGEAVILRPSATFYGRYWDGVNGSAGHWDLPEGYRTIVHEWAHYALALYDEYGEASERAAPTYCTCSELPQLLNPSVATVCGNVTRADAASIMAFHYTASELWHPIVGPLPSCINSDQGRFHGEPDWNTLSNWFELQAISNTLDLPDLSIPSVPSPGPEQLIMTGPTADLFGRRNTFTLNLPLLTLSGALKPPEIFTSALRVQLDDTTSPTQTLMPQIYLLQNDKTDKSQHIVYEGTLTDASTASDIGGIDLWGITPDDRLSVTVDRYRTGVTPGGRFIYESTGQPKVEELKNITATANSWGSTLDLLYLTTVVSGNIPGQLVGMVVFLDGSHNNQYSTAPRAQICVPDAKIGCPDEWNKAMQYNSAANRWATAFAPLSGTAELPLYGVIRIISPKEGTDQLTRWFRDAGGVGPGHKIGNAAPLRDGLAMVDRIDDPELETKCNRVMIMPAAEYQALLIEMDAAALVSPPLDIDILFGNDVNGQCASTLKREREEFKPLRLTLFYSEDALKRLGISEEKELSIMQFSPSTESWVQLPSTVDPNLNRLSALITADGIFAIGWYP
jgi:hypothetical protein